MPLESVTNRREMLRHFASSHLEKVNSIARIRQEEMATSFQPQGVTRHAGQRVGVSPPMRYDVTDGSARVRDGNGAAVSDTGRAVNEGDIFVNERVSAVRDSGAARSEYSWTGRGLCLTCLQRPIQVINLPCNCLCNCVNCQPLMTKCARCQQAIHGTRVTS
ncbi:uncharacterized protein LOC131939592 [Physella acuta]|uniref:uncharacterized protein LOC131939592 n=1 Tax=Physella acuta TaxID=109671 RepID=UPI0027DBF941|nr:uncharacterized protein LOC131939592 [Physella acuta]